MSYKNITREHVLQAVAKIEAENIKLTPSSIYEVIINDKRYPPKEIMKFANFKANGILEWNETGGEATNKYLKDMGFDIESKTFDNHADSNSLTGRVWKVGTKWGSEAKSYYKKIKELSIIIVEYKKAKLNIGDIAMITEGFTVRSLGRVTRISEPSISFPEFKYWFDEYGIEYSEFIHIAHVQWYELEEEFIYRHQAGIAEVHGSHKEKALMLWQSNFISYWIFQCNPNEFDIDLALRNNWLNYWTVTAHKDKIKVNDKVILWVTGKYAGCYAFAEIIDLPKEITTHEMDNLWKSKPKDSLFVELKLIHNLVEKPLLWKNIQSEKGLENLNVGLKGTNYSATKSEYSILLKLSNMAQEANSKEFDIFINTIFYGPPGTGKTYEMQELQKKFVKEPENNFKDALKNTERTIVIASALHLAKEKLDFSAICKLPLVKYFLFLNDEEATPDKISKSINQNNTSGKIKWFLEDGGKYKFNPASEDALKKEIDATILNEGGNLVQHGTEYALNRYTFITFHQKYSYEDFIEGIKPRLDQGTLGFELKDGVFKQACLKAIQAAGYDGFEDCYNDDAKIRKDKFKNAPPFAIFIDEINRANISAVFGELITLIEEDKRIAGDHEMWVTLPTSGDWFAVPPNLYIIGTMNTADRSIAMLDVALRRRFEFVNMPPNAEHENIKHDQARIVMKSLNETILKRKNSADLLLGHSFFMAPKVTDDSTLIEALNKKIVPLLMEYFNGKASEVKDILIKAGATIDDTKLNRGEVVVTAVNPQPAQSND